MHSSPQFVVYALSWYLDVVSPDWEGIVLAENGQYQAVMPVPVRQKLGISYVHQPLFCQQLGIFGNGNPLDFLTMLQKHYRFCARYHLNSTDTASLNKQPLYNTSTELLQTHILDLSPDYQAIYSRYNADRKMNLKRAKQAQWKCQEGTDIKPLITLFKENHANQITGGVAKGAYDLLENLYQVIQNQGTSQLWYALKNGQIEAGCWFVFSGSRVIYLFNAASPIGRKGNARTWLLDRFFQEYAGNKLVFDFESPTIEPIDAFYESFGAIAQPFYRLRYNHFAWWMKALQRLWQRRH